MDYKNENITCNVCGADNTVAVSQKAQFNFPFNLVLCKDCGLGYLNPRWDSESYLHYYQHEYDKYYRANLNIDSRVNVEQAKQIVRRLQSNDLVPESAAHILEIGSGEGANLREVSALFPDAQTYSIEPSIHCQIQLNKMNVTMLANNVEEAWENDHQGKFDIIILRHVLEHLRDPADALKKIRKALTDDGILYIGVPDNLHPNRALEGDWFRVVHTYYFNKYSMHNLLSIANMEALVMKEGDSDNVEEIFVVAKKSETNPQVDISVDHYDQQKKLFDRKLRSDRTLAYRFAMFSRKVKRHLRKLVS